MKLHLYAKLSEKSGWTRNSIERYISNAPMKYKTYTIPKRTSGQRLIAHPAKKLKLLQRLLVTEMSPYISEHHRAMAYRKGVGIKQNATLHKNNSYVLKLDFNDFFNSITPDMFINVLKLKGLELTNADILLISKTFFWNKSKKTDGKLVLSVGAPSSPFVSNVTMYYFDEYIESICISQKITYSRYADDLTFSTSIKGNLFHIPKIVKKKLELLFLNKITINDLKTIYSSKAHNRHVTGITINNNGELSVGRERKRIISSLIHKFILKKLDSSEVQYLQGLLSFASYVEPNFRLRMELKYSNKVILKLLRFRGEYE